MKKYLLASLTLILSIFLIVPLVQARDYSLTNSNINIIVNESGNIQINEEINYAFFGCYSEVYREPEISRYQEGLEPYLVNISAYCSPECEVFDRNYEIAGNFGEICDKTATFFVNMDIENGLFNGKDFTTFHYKIWGDQWDKTLTKLDGKIELPFEPEEVFFNPYNNAKYHIEGKTIFFEAEYLNNYLEVRVIMPKIDGEFLLLPQTKKQVMQQQKNYEIKYNLAYYIPIIIVIIMLFFMIYIPIKLFKKYGKEFDIAYHQMYEREPPKGFKPYMINSLVMGNVGSTTHHAITATILDLVRRKHLTLHELKGSGLLKSDIEFTFNNSKDTMSLAEKQIYNYLKALSKNNKLKWKDFLKHLKRRSEGLEYLLTITKFEKYVKSEFNSKKFFDETGYTKWMTFSFFMFIINVGLFIFSVVLLGQPNYSISKVFLFFPIGIIYGIVGLVLSSKIFGRFTIEGLELHERAINYKKFLTDMTLMKKYPPASLIIWEEHLIYATLFGVAAKTIKNMKVVVKDTTIKNSSLYPMYNYALISHISSSYSVATASTSSSSGGGGVGGGFGGGGGGAR